MNDEEFKREIGERLATLEAKVESILKNHFPTIQRSMDEIKLDVNKIWEKISKNRPSWNVAIVITFLCSLCTALVVIAFRR